MKRIVALETEIARIMSSSQSGKEEDEISLSIEVLSISELQTELPFVSVIAVEILHFGVISCALNFYVCSLLLYISYD